jgi:hypothetical protein
LRGLWRGLLRGKWSDGEKSESGKGESIHGLKSIRHRGDRVKERIALRIN